MADTAFLNKSILDLLPAGITNIMLITGAMRSGKSSFLMDILKKLVKLLSDLNVKNRVVLIRHANDKIRNNGDEFGAITYNGEKPISDGSGGYKLITNCTGFTELHSHKISDILCNYDYIFIDEGQFFGGIHELCKAASYRKDKSIFISLLNGTFERVMFDGIANLFSLATDIRYLKANCDECKTEGTGVYSSRVDKDNVQQIKIAKSNSDYRTHCPLCYAKFNRIN